jgi:hypothetical protein
VSACLGRGSGAYAMCTVILASGSFAVMNVVRSRLRIRVSRNKLFLLASPSTIYKNASHQEDFVARVRLERNRRNEALAFSALKLNRNSAKQEILSARQSRGLIDTPYV